MIDISKHHDYEFNRLPSEIVNKAVSSLQLVLLPDTINEIKSAYNEDKDTWWASAHFNWGMTIRNFLRDKVCSDDKLPSGNWDDYYVRLVERACGLK